MRTRRDIQPLFGKMSLRYSSKALLQVIGVSKIGLELLDTINFSRLTQRSEE